ncbi:MAG: bifunctional riboflavin kinase/FAD synthetase [Alphaproteobacteria bacterium]|nr:bifunctional riboflavin kinase/FAD synthetase [Alphaproteobacteria bacterium]
MDICSSLKDLAENTEPLVVAIGNFDGVHRGHQALLQQAKDTAKSKNAKFGVLTFEPHPKTLFRPEDRPTRITPPEVKHWRLQEFGVEVLVSLPFDWDFASQSAEEFIKVILQDGMHAKHVVVGDDFRFGQMRKGAPADIEQAGIGVSIVEKVQGEDGQIFSSSRVRTALRAGDLKTANAVLGWEWEMRGEVMKGDQRGRELGYPTANMHLGDTIHPAYGVYAAMVQVEGEEQWRGAAINIGIRPMFEVPTAHVESFIFDFDEEIYGKTLRVKPVERLRSEAKFNSLDALIAQMDKDCEKAHEVLGL